MNLECLEVSDNEIPVSDISDSFTHHSVSNKGIYEYCNESIIFIPHVYSN